MIIRYKTQSGEITLNLFQGELDDDTLQKIARLLNYVDKTVGAESRTLEDLSRTTALNPAQNAETDLKIAYWTEAGPLIRLDILDILNNSQIVSSKQIDAFMVIAYLLKTRQDKNEIAVREVAKLMRESGVNCTNFQNLTPKLAKKLNYISKSPGNQYFSLTGEGEDYAKRLIERSSRLSLQ